MKTTSLSIAEYLLLWRADIRVLGRRILEAKRMVLEFRRVSDGN